MSVSSRDSSHRTRLLRLAAIAAYLLLLAILVTWPLTPDLADGSLAAPAEADLLLSQYLILWGAHAITSPEAELADANIFHPADNAYGYSDIPLSHSLLVLPLVRLGATPDQMYGLLVLFSLLFGGLGVVALTGRLGLSTAAGVGAATVYVANPAHIARYVNPQLFGDHWLPWLLWALFGWLAAAGLRRAPDADGAAATAPPVEIAWRAALVALLLVLHALSGSHNAVFGTLLGAALVAFHLLGAGRRIWSDRELRTALVLSAPIVVLLTLACLLPVFRTYLAVYEELVRGRLGDPVLRAQILEGYSSGLREFLSGASDWWLSVDERFGWPGRWLNTDRALRAHLFPGLVPVLLAGVGLAGLLPRPPRGRRALALALDLATLLTVALAGRIAWNGAYPGWLPGAGLLALTAAGAAWARRRLDPAGSHLLQSVGPRLRRQWKRTPDLLVVGAAFALLTAIAIGPDSIVYQLARRLPGIDLIRAPSRFWLPALVLLACLAGYGIDRLRRRRAFPLLLAGAAIVFLAEAELVPLRSYPVPYPPDELTTWLAEQPGNGAVAEFPIRLTPPAAVRQMIRSTHHWKPLLIGYSGSEPPGYRRRMRLLRRTFPGDGAVRLLRELGVEFVIIDRAGYGRRGLLEIAELDGLDPGPRFGSRQVYLLR